jgi:thiol-disulfide isomerase/thioredoxin
MKKIQISIIILLVASIFLEFLVGPIRGYLTLPGIQALEVCAAADFLIYALTTLYFLSKYKSDLSQIQIIGLMVLGLMLFEVPMRLVSISGTLFTIPELLMRISGIGAGYFWYERRRLIHKINLSVAVLILLFTLAFGYDLWMKKLQYGNFTGSVSLKGPGSIYLKDKNNKNIKIEKGKLVVMDFWFVGCGSCMVEFPVFQKVYTKYKNNLNVQFYSVNQPFKYDKDVDRFKLLTDIGYDFPMAVCPDRSLVKELKVAVYPTIIVIDTNGNIVFKGDTQNLESALKLYL